MKRTFFILLCCLAVGASSPKPGGYVTDSAGILNHETVKIIHGLAYELQQKSGAQLAVVTVKSLDGTSVEDYAWKLFEQWGIGAKDKDTGVLLLIAPNERKLRIEVGYGFEGALPDGLAGEIIRKDILPYFKKGDMNTGVLRGAVVILSVMAKEMNVSLTGNYRIPERAPAGPSIAAVLLNLLFFSLIFGGRFFFFPLLFMGGRGYYSGGGGGFGGFGGFGGGLSGGGGASGSW
ncbi:MAG: TPM domain-containing protein [Elusimicrobia bacterium]|nr:TPM domain-containing protein [Elusimicrobiota bacterium]